MFYRPRIQLKRLLAICLLYLPSAVDAFTLISASSRYDRKRVQVSTGQSKYSPVKTQLKQLQATVAPAEESVRPKREQLSKEAQELLATLDAKAASEPNAPLLIVA